MPAFAMIGGALGLQANGPAGASAAAMLELARFVAASFLLKREAT